jgi:hypothetical protein
MKRISLLVLMVATMLTVMGLTAAPAFAAQSSLPGVGGQSGGVCGGQGNSVGTIVPGGIVGSAPGGQRGGCSSGCSSGKGTP